MNKCKIFFLILSFLIGTAISFAQTPQDQFNKAKELYDNGNNKDCIVALQAVEKQVGANPRIYSLYTNAYVADKDYINAAISLNKFKKLVGNKRTDAIQSILDLEIEINSGVELAEKNHKETIEKKRMVEADEIIANTKKMNEQKRTVLVNEYKPPIPKDAALRVAKNKDGKYGFIDEYGTIAIEPKYDLAYSFKNGKALVSLLGNWMQIDMMGNILQKFNYKNVYQHSEKLFSFKENNLIGFIDESGKIIHKAQFPCLNHNENFLSLCKQFKFILIDYEGNLISQQQYDQINTFSEERAVVKSDELYGFIDKFGKLVVPMNYKYMGEKFSEGLIRFSNGGSSGGFLDSNGKVAFEHNYYCYSDFSEGLVRVSNDPSGYSVGYIDKTGKLVIPIKFHYGENFSEGLALVTKKNGTKYYIDKTGKEIIKIKTKFLYNSGTNFSDGLAKVQISDKEYYFMDKSGNIIFTLNKYENVDDFYDGLACVGNNGVYGFVDRNGKEVIPLKYGTNVRFKNGEAIIFNGKDYVVIDQTGKELRKAY